MSQFTRTVRFGSLGSSSSHQSSSPKSPPTKTLSSTSPHADPKLLSPTKSNYFNVTPSNNTFSVLLAARGIKHSNQVTHTFHVQNTMHTHTMELSCTTSHAIILINGKRGRFFFLQPRETCAVDITIVPVDQILNRLHYKQSKGMKALIRQSVLMSAQFRTSLQIDPTTLQRLQEQNQLLPPPLDPIEHKIVFKIIHGASPTKNSPPKKKSPTNTTPGRRGRRYSHHATSLQHYQKQAASQHSPPSSPALGDGASPSHYSSPQQQQQWSNQIARLLSTGEELGVPPPPPPPLDNEHEPLPPPSMPPPPLGTADDGADQEPNNDGILRLFQQMSTTTKESDNNKTVTIARQKVGRYFPKETRSVRKRRLGHGRKRSALPPGLLADLFS